MRLAKLRELGSESLVYSLAGIVSRGFSIFLVPIYTRLFQPADYGVMGILLSFNGILTLLAVLGMDGAAARWYRDTEDPEDRKKTMATWVWCQFTVSCLSSLLLCLFSREVSVLLLGNEEGAVLVRLLVLAIPLAVFGRVLIAWHRYERKPWPATAMTLGSALGTILSTLIFVVVLRRGVRGVYEAALAADLCGALTAAYILREAIHPRRLERARLKEMLAYALPLLPAGLAFWIINLSDRFFVKAHASTAEVGLYQVAAAFSGLLSQAAGAFQLAWAPFAMSIHKEPGAKTVYGDVFLAYVWAACMASSGLALFAPEVIRLLATRAYAGAAPVVGLLCLGTVALGLRSIASIGMAIVKKPWPVTTGALLGACVSVGLNMLLVPRLGKTGAALSGLLSNLLVSAYLFTKAQAVYAVPYRFKPALGLFALSLGVMAAGGAWPEDRLWSGILVKVLLLSLYIPALFLLRLMSLDQGRRLFRSLAPRGGKV